MNLEQLKDLERAEFTKRDKELCFIASENYCSEAVLDACGSIFMQKYSEGFPQKRYYEGCEVVDEMEQECIDTVLELFNAKNEYYANVQPHSGSNANMIVYNAILQPDDVVLAPDVASMGHISHSHPKSFISKYHKVYTYGVDENGLLDYDEIERIALEVQPKLIIAGASNYSREIDFKRFAQICNKVKQKKHYLASSLGCSLGNDCYLMADIAHTSILNAHDLLMSPVGYADFITFTTHKCMASARSACILYKKEFHKKICSSTIPAVNGGALQNMVYGKLIGFKEALTEESKEYSKQILLNAKAMANTFKNNGIPIVTGDTENHLFTIDLRNFDITGKQLSSLLAKAGFITNANTVPNDPRSFLETSGVRIGLPAVTKRGLTELDVIVLACDISNIINLYKDGKTPDKNCLNDNLESLAISVEYYSKKYPLKNIYPNRYKYLFGDE